MRPIVISVALMVLSAAFNLTVGKYASNVPDWLIIACWLVPLIPLVWAGLSHPKLLRHRQWYRDRLKSAAVSTIVLTAIVGCVILLSVGGFAHGVWGWLTKPQQSASNVSPNQQQPTINSPTPLPVTQQAPLASQPKHEAPTMPAQRTNIAPRKGQTALGKTSLPLEARPTISKSGNSLEIRAGDGGSNGSPGGSLTIRGGDVNGGSGNGGNVLIAPDGIQNTSGTNSPAVGSVTQGSDSISQIGAGNVATVNQVRPLDPNDPYPTKTDQEVAALALEEADKVQKLAQDCLDDLEALKYTPPKTPHHIEDSTPDATRGHFRLRVRDEIETINKVHDSILARVPTLKDRDMESYYQNELHNKDGCWLDDYDHGVPQYLRQLSQGLLAHRRANN